MRPTMPVPFAGNDHPTIPVPPHHALDATVELFLADWERATIATRPVPPPVGPAEPFAQAPSFAPYRAPTKVAA